MTRDIAVIGAGIAGLAAATMLARAGNRVRLLERFDAPGPVGAGLLLQPTGLAAMARLGLDGAIAALGAPIARLEGRTIAGRPIFDLRYDDLAPGLAGLGVHRAALHGVLWDAFAASGAALETGAAVTGLAPAAAGGARPVDARGRTHARADLVVDASGAGSPLRALLGGRPARAFPFGAVWAVVPDTGFAPATLAQRYAGARIMLGHLPVGRATPDDPPLAALFWSLRRADLDAWRAGHAAWRAQIAELWPALAAVPIPGPDRFTPAFYAQFTARRPWCRGLVLIGDAAHATSPQLGQGANQALLDAIALADALAATPDTGAALARYAARRRAHVRFYQLASRVMTPLFQSNARPAAWLRDLTFPHLRRSAWLRREMVRTLAGLKTGPFTWSPANHLAG